MKRRTFLWLSSFLVPAASALSFGKNGTKAIIQCDHTNLTVRWFVTEVILLKQSDGTYECNAYRECVQIAGEALLAKGTVYPGDSAGADCFVGRLRFESEPLKWEQCSAKDIVGFVKSVKDWIGERPDLFDPVDKMCRKLRFGLNGKPLPDFEA